MNKNIYAATFALGAFAVAWIAISFFGTNWLALAVTAAIAVVYGYGAVELSRFRHATKGLVVAIQNVPANLANLESWVATVPEEMQSHVRLRLDGSRVGLPGPGLTPYLVGLLVMLGMLGTFLGMVVTLNGAVFALDGSNDLQAIRSVFSAPIKGLGLAFGTSVAGVATSAMLGLMSALSRHDRVAAGLMLDAAVATTLKRFSHAQQRQETHQALQLQAQMLPAVVEQLQGMMVHMERMGQQWGDRLHESQESFHTRTQDVYRTLAHSVETSLRECLAQGAQAAGETVRPVMTLAMAGVAQQAATMQEQMVATTRSQIQEVLQRLDETASLLTSTWTQASTQQQEAHVALAAHQSASLQDVAIALRQEWKGVTAQVEANANKTLEQASQLIERSEALVDARLASEERWASEYAQRMEQTVQTLRTELGALRTDEAARAMAAVDRLDELQSTVATHLTTLGTALEEPIARLIETASEAPRAAAEVIGKLRNEVANSAARDNELLEERGRILSTLGTLLDGINHASAEQRGVIDAMVTSSAAALNHVNEQFTASVDAQADKLADITANVAGSAVEVSALSASFSQAITIFADANEKLIANLQRIEGALDKSMARSDEQLAYYVAQAREIIDLSMTSQKAVFDELRHLPARKALVAKEAA